MRLTVILIAVIMFAGCSLQKRRYQKGVYVEWNRHHQSGGEVGLHKSKRTYAVSKEQEIKAHQPATVAPENAEHLTASAERGVPAIQSRKKPIKYQGIKADPDTCDVIVMKSGEEIRVKMLEVGVSEVRYHKCNMGGAVYVSRKQDIFMVRYANGQKEVFNSSQPKSEPGVQKANTKREHPQTMTVLLLAVLGWIVGIGSIPAIIIGNKALREIKAQPDKYSGEETIKIAVTLSWVKVALVSIIFFFVMLIILANI
jgi:hypothetical protein